MNNPLVSVVIPVYNVESYLHQCVDSVIAQTYQNWECVLVDDGSTDKSGAICEEYAQKDKRIKVVHQRNCGLAVARQTGLDNINGVFICAIDADDWIDSDHIDNMVKVAIQKKADIVINPYYMNYPDGREYYMECKPTAFDKKTLQCEVLIGTYHAGVVLKLIARHIFTENHIEQAPYNYYEDMYTYLSCLEYTHNVAYNEKPTYHYRQNAASLTNDKNLPKRIRMYEECMNNLLSVSQRYGYMSDVDLVNALYSRANYEKGRLLTFLKQYKTIRPYLLKYYPDSPSIIRVSNLRTWGVKNAMNGHFIPYLIFKIINWTKNHIKKYLCKNS